jgi:hypothetical protein
LRGLAGTVRALIFPCPAATVRAGVNEVRLRQVDGGPSQQIVWVEIRVGAP